MDYLINKSFPLSVNYNGEKKMIARLILASLSLLLTFSTGLAGEISFVGSTNKNPLEYQPGEQMTFSIQCLEDGKPVQG